MTPEEREKWFTLGSGADYLGIADKTLRKYLKDLGIKPVPHRGDQRMRYYSQTQLNQLADAKGLIPGQKPPTIRSLALEVRDLRHELEALRMEFEALHQHMTELNTRITSAPLPPALPGPIRPARSSQPPGPALWEFVRRHISPPMEVGVAVQQAESSLGSGARRNIGEPLSIGTRRKLAESWRGKPGYHQCKEDPSCPCHHLLPPQATAPTGK